MREKTISMRAPIGVYIKIDDNKQTTVSLDVPNGNTTVWATGRAKLNPSDLYSEEVGINIALGRALEKVGRKLAKSAEKRALTYEQAMKEWDRQAKDERDLARLRAEKAAAKSLARKMQAAVEEASAQTQAKSGHQKWGEVKRRQEVPLTAGLPDGNS